MNIFKYTILYEGEEGKTETTEILAKHHNDMVEQFCEQYGSYNKVINTGPPVLVNPDEYTADTAIDLMKDAIKALNKGLEYFREYDRQEALKYFKRAVYFNDLAQKVLNKFQNG